jgi:PAS domain S-box-containing protein
MPPEDHDRSRFNPVGWLRLSSSWQTLEANEPMLEMLEVASLDELLDVPSIELVAPECREEMLRQRLQRFQGKSSTYESVLLGRRGTRRAVIISGVPILQNAELAGVILTVVDVTQLRQIEERQRETLERYRAVVNALGDGVLVVANTGAILEANASASRILDVPIASLHRWQDLAARWQIRDEQGRELTLAELPIATTLKTGMPCRNVVLQVERPDAALIWVELNTEPMFQPGDMIPRAVVASFHDISELKESHRQVSVREARLNRLLDAMPDLLFVMSADGVYLDYRASRPELLFFPPASFLGKNMAEVLPADILAVSQPALKASVETGQIQTIEYSSNLLGARQYFEARSMPFDSDTVLVVVRDVTEARLAEQQLRQHEEERLHLARLSALGAMSAGISHEIKQPLHAIANFAAASLNILSGGDERAVEQVREWLQKIAAQAFRASEIVNRFRRFSSPTAQITSVPVSELLRDSVGLVESELRRHGVQVEIDNEAHDQPFAGDRIQFEQVLVNFLVNACEAVQHVPAKERRLRLHARFDEGWLTCEVSDNGSGLPDVPAAQLFDAFFTTKPNGMGLGLAISRTIIESHGGRIWARSNAPRGAIFGFSIPPSKHAAD